MTPSHPEARDPLPAAPPPPENRLFWAAILLLWVPILALRLLSTPAQAPLPVQARLQGILAGRMMRLAELSQPPLPEALRARALAEAGALLDEGLEHRPEDPGLRARRALVARVAEGPTAARAILAAPLAEPPGGPTPTASPDPTLDALSRLYAAPPPTAAEREALGPALESGLDGFYRYRARSDAGLATPADREEQERRAQQDHRDLLAVVALTLGNGLLGLVALLAWPLYGRRFRGESPGFRASWLAPAALATVLALQYLALAVGIPLSALLSRNLSPVAGVFTLQAILYALGLGIVVTALPGLAPGSHGPPWRLLGLDRTRPLRAALGLPGFWAALPAVFLATLATAALLGRSPFSRNPALTLILDASPGDLALLALLVAVVGPFYEEVVFRGLLHGGLRGRLGPWGAGLASASLFALIHGDPQAILALGTLGALFAFLYEWTGSLWPAVLAHALWNGTTVLVVVLVLGGP